MSWHLKEPPKWGWFFLAIWLATAVTVDAQVRQTPAPRAVAAESPEPPLARPLPPEPKDPADKAGWVEKIVERRVAAMFDAADPDRKEGPITDFLAAQLVALIGKLIKYLLVGLLTSALIALAWKNWYWLAAWVAGHVGLSWLAGRHGGSKA